MKRFLLIFALFFLTFAAHAADTCEQCMARCPHTTREIRDCDRGCPAVCNKGEVAAIKKERSCQSCLSECPHNTRDLRPCDLGCKEACDRDSLFKLLKKNVEKKGCGWGEAARSQPGSGGGRNGFEMEAPNVDPGFDIDVSGGAH